MKKDKELLQVIGLGIISGMRSTLGSTIAAHYLAKKHKGALSKSKLAFIQSPVTSVITKLLSAAEMAGDKLPNAPDRIIASSVIARTAFGAFAGASITTANKTSVAKGILIGGLSALAATFATFYLRKYIDKSTTIKEPVTGVLEDVLAISSGLLLMR